MVQNNWVQSYFIFEDKLNTNWVIEFKGSDPYLSLKLHKVVINSDVTSFIKVKYNFNHCRLNMSENYFEFADIGFYGDDFDKYSHRNITSIIMNIIINEVLINENLSLVKASHVVGSETFWRKKGFKKIVDSLNNDYSIFFKTLRFNLKLYDNYKQVENPF